MAAGKLARAAFPRCPLPSFPACRPTYVSTYLPTYQPTNIPIYLRTYLPTYPPSLPPPSRIFSQRTVPSLIPAVWSRRELSRGGFVQRVYPRQSASRSNEFPFALRSRRFVDRGNYLPTGRGATDKKNRGHLLDMAQHGGLNSPTGYKVFHRGFPHAADRRMSGRNGI